MLALAAARLGFKTHVFSDETESCAFYVADATTRAHYSDTRALEKFAAACDVVTFEFENVPDDRPRISSTITCRSRRDARIARDRPGSLPGEELYRRAWASRPRRFMT